MNIRIFLLLIVLQVGFHSEGFGTPPASPKKPAAVNKATKVAAPLPKADSATNKSAPKKPQAVATLAGKTNDSTKPQAKAKTGKELADSQEIKKTDDPLADKKMLVVAPPKPMKAGRVYLDGVACAVNGPERCQIFCETDKYRPGLAPSAARNDTEKLEMFAFNELVYQNWMQLIERQKMDPNDNSIVNNYIDGLCRQNNWSMSDLEKILAQSGYTLQEGIKELKKMYAVNYMSEMKMQGVVVPENEIEAYYKEHPVYNEPRVKISRAFVSFSQVGSKDELLSKIAAHSSFITSWEDEFWLKESEMAEHMRFLLSLDVNKISEPLETNGGFELFKVSAKKPQRLVSLKKRYKHIVAELRQEKSVDLFKKYKDQLFDSASIVYYSHDATASA
ncbi:hypothetical protein HYX58_04410 [Candidatus Dependentiae bacterium]|nr:hypothetical protein [Candidatus Dependentiae bacterium]